MLAQQLLHSNVHITRHLKLGLLMLGLALSSLALGEANSTAKKSSSLPIEELYLFSEVFHQIRHNYVSEVSDKELINLAIKGMVEGLDPHSSYLNQQEYKDLKESTTGEFAGIGVEVSIENGQIKVLAPIDDSPALKAGIKSGDIIIQIDDHKVQASTIKTAVEKMRGPVGSKIKLIVSRGENKKYITFKIKRAVIKVKSVKSHFLESGYGYMRVSQFQKTTADEANKQLKAFAKTGKTKGLIIDLRNNPGGLLLAAVDLADLLLSPGLVVYTQGKAADSRENYNSTQYQLLASTNIVVLMNEGSASASEILAGALQDRKRAIIAGTQSFGKGSVQTILALPKNRAMKLTTSRYYTPNGRSIQAEGITPDIVIPEAKITTIEHSTQMSEADLAGHLDHEGKSPKTLQSVNQHLEGDYQLQHALNLLKAMQLQQ